MRTSAWFRLGLWGPAIATLVGAAGCGVLSARNTEFSSQARTTDGRELFVEDIEAIVNDASLSEDDKREAFLELGVEDEDLIAALLTL